MPLDQSLILRMIHNHVLHNVQRTLVGIQQGKKVVPKVVERTVSVRQICHLGLVEKSNIKCFSFASNKQSPWKLSVLICCNLPRRWDSFTVPLDVQNFGLE